MPSRKITPTASFLHGHEFPPTKRRTVFHSCSYHQLGLPGNSQEQIITSLLHKPGSFLFIHTSILRKYRSRASNSFLPFFSSLSTAHKTHLNKKTHHPNQNKKKNKHKARTLNVASEKKSMLLQYRKHFKKCFLKEDSENKCSSILPNILTKIKKQAWCSVKSWLSYPSKE